VLCFLADFVGSCLNKRSDDGRTESKQSELCTVIRTVGLDERNAMVVRSG
jgi:hypothetical protein